MDRPFFSIIVPIYNVEEYLSQCIDSVLNQDYKDFELILINDKSTDNSLSICKDYEMKDNRIKIVEHEVNKGLAATRNTGIDNALGKWIVYVDSDDYFSSNKFLSNLYSKCKEDVDIVFYGYSYYDGDRDKIIKKRRENIEVTVTGKTTLEKLIQLYKSNNLNWNAWSQACNIKFLNKNKLKFDSSLRQAEDCDYFFRMLAYEPKISMLNDTSYMYRQRASSLTGDPKDTTMYAIRVTNKICHFVKNANILNMYKECLLNILTYNYITMLLNIQYNLNGKDKEVALKLISDSDFMINCGLDIKTKSSLFIIKLFGVNKGSFIVSKLHSILR